MTDFIMQAISFLRTRGDASAVEFLSALEEVLELGSRYVVRSGSAAGMACADDLLIGPAGLGVAGTSIFIPFDCRLRLSDRAPDHFRMTEQPSSCFRRTAFSFVSGEDRCFGMISRDDDLDPSKHVREAVTDALGNMKRIAALQALVPQVTICDSSGRSQTSCGLMIDENGFRSPTIDRRIRWVDVRAFDITDRVRLECPDATVDVSI